MYNNNLSNIIDSGRQPYRAQEKRSPDNVTDNRDDLSLNEERIMSKLSIISLISCAIVIPSAMADFGHAPNRDQKGVVNFSGHVYSNSCIIEAGDKDKQVKLNPVLNTLVSKLHATQLQQFSIKVKGCYINEKIVPKLAWNVNSPLTRDGYLKNTTRGGAQNVALVLKDNREKTINLRNKNDRFEPEKDYLLHGNDSPTLTYKFSVGYIIPFENSGSSYVQPGPVSAQANYSITYL
jgi:type 1 fimbria pilin